MLYSVFIYLSICVCVCVCVCVCEICCFAFLAMYRGHSMRTF